MNPRYTIEWIRKYPEDEETIEFFREVGNHINLIYGLKFDWRKMDLADYIRGNRFVLCRRDGRPVGAMLSRLHSSVFDPETLILKQDLLYAKRGTRAANLLLKDFIDFGRANANHVITTIGKKTNIKARSLENLGFEELETLYRLET